MITGEWEEEGGALTDALVKDHGDRVVVQGFMFFPRGGSAQVVRYLCHALARVGWGPRLAAGSVGVAGDSSHAATFFAGLDVHAVDFTPALAAWERGDDPLDQTHPLHPSFEDRPGAPDRVFARVSPALAERQVAVWARALDAAGAPRADVLHLHHLTPLHDAALRVAPELPVVTHLHGTELLMLEEIGRLSANPRRATGVQPPDLTTWPYAEHWVRRMRAAARRSGRVLVVSPDQAVRAARILGLPDEQLTVVPNGVDTKRFDRLELRLEDRLSLLRRWLVDEPRGWDETGTPGSVRYSSSDLAAFVDAASGRPRPVLLYVSRFTAVKRLPLLIRAYARLRTRLGPVAPLVVWGGHPGEWEGEHPQAIVRRYNVGEVFFVGWRGHDDLRLGLACADLLVVPSVGEAFGQVYLEAMASGLPVVATRTGGPPSFVNLDPGRPDGWLVPPDDEGALADALAEAVAAPEERRARADAAYFHARRRYSWAAVAEQVVEVYDGLCTR
jgi:glycosyltransferase involved in cell wall biosynthesis